MFIRVKTHLRLNSVPEKAHLEIQVNAEMIFCQNLTPPPNKHPDVCQNTVLLFLFFIDFRNENENVLEPVISKILRMLSKKPYLIVKKPPKILVTRQ